MGVRVLRKARDEVVGVQAVCFGANSLSDIGEGLILQIDDAIEIFYF